MEAADAAELVARVLRRPRDETQLTKALGRLMEESPPLAEHALRTLLRAVDRADVAASVRTPVRLRGEQRASRKTIVRRERSLGRMDWQFTGPEFFIVVEVKLDAGLGELQLENYLRDSRVRSASVGGLLVLAKQPLWIASDVSDHPKWLGTTTWSKVLSNLADVPQGPALTATHLVAWRAILKTAGDYGDAVIAAPLWTEFVTPTDSALAATIHAAVDHAVPGLRTQLRIASPRGVADADLLMRTRSRSPSVRLRLSGMRSTSPLSR